MKRLVTVIALLLAGLLLPAVGGAQAATSTQRPDTVLLGDAPPAGFQVDCVWCGHIYNDDNARVLHITTHWPGRENPDTWRFLNPGQNSHDIGVDDADGFFVPGGCTATVAFVQNLGPGWYKVYNGQHIHVTDIAC